MFDDIDENAWYGNKQQGCIKNAYELGIMRGKTETNFDPIELLPEDIKTRLKTIIESDDYQRNPEKYLSEIDEIMREANEVMSSPNVQLPEPVIPLFDPLGSLTIAEAVKMAAVLRSYYSADSYEFTQGTPWYQTYVDYAVSNGIVSSGDFADYTAPATRAQMAYIFAKALPASELTAINTVSALPDVASTDKYASQIYQLYRAGVLTGSDAQGSFKPNSTITRAEAAAIISRVAMSEQRKSFIL